MELRSETLRVTKASKWGPCFLTQVSSTWHLCQTRHCSQLDNSLRFFVQPVDTLIIFDQAHQKTSSSPVGPLLSGSYPNRKYVTTDVHDPLPSLVRDFQHVWSFSGPGLDQSWLPVFGLGPLSLRPHQVGLNLDGSPSSAHVR